VKSNFKLNGLIYILILIAAVAIFSYVFSSRSPSPAEIPLSQAIALSQENKIQKIVVEDNALLITTTDGTQLKAYKETYLSVYDIKGLNLDGVVIDVKGSGVFNWSGLLINFLPLLIFGALLYFLFRSARGANNQALSFGRSRARLFPANTPTVTFNDVAGVDEAKQEVQEIVDFLKSREKFQSLGARIPRGVLLIGAPGTGKTLLARAIAGEAGVPFYSISGSEFVEMFVGVGASRVRDLFDQAKRNAPCIIFIDEIDAVGRHRGAGLGGSHDEREQTLNQILTEMDGFDTNVGVIVMAATNRPDILDPALLRPGRFDRRVVLDRPDINGRVAILKVHSKGKPLDKAVDLEVLARQTAMFSGADLANLVNEAAILAARRGKKVIQMSELEESIDRVIAGPERKSRRISPKEKKVAAYHEAGHALVAHMTANIERVRKITIIPRGVMGGYTKTLEEDKVLYTRSYYKDQLAFALGGRASEELIFNELSTGAASDIKNATELARKMITDYGMSDKLGPRTFGDKQELVFLGREISEQRDYGEKVADIIDEEMNKLIVEAHERARQILTDNKERLIKLGEILYEKETLEGEELEALLNESAASSTAESMEAPPAGDTTSPAKPMGQKPRTVPQLNPKQLPATD
jgi:cell division protease FtsH